MLFLSDEHMQHGLTDPWWPAMSVMWCDHSVRTEKCITSGERESARGLSWPPHWLSLHWARPASGGDRRQAWAWATLGPTVGTETLAHIGPWSSGALTSGHWTRGHVSRQPAAGNLPVRGRRAPWQPLWTLSETLSAPVRVLSSSCWLTDSNSSLRFGHNCHHCGVRVRYQHQQWAVTVS